MKSILKNAVFCIAFSFSNDIMAQGQSPQFFKLGGNTLSGNPNTSERLGFITPTDLRFITNGSERFRLSSTGDAVFNGDVYMESLKTEAEQLISVGVDGKLRGVLVPKNPYIPEKECPPTDDPRPTWKSKLNVIYAPIQCNPGLRIGIGTENPTELLEVAGNARITGALKIGSGSVTINGSTVGTGDDDKLTASSGEFSIGGGSPFAFNQIKVGIGNTTPQAALDVSGWISLGGGYSGPSYGPATGSASGSGGIYFPSTANDWIRLTSKHDGVDNSQLVIYTGDNDGDGIVFSNYDVTKATERDYLTINRTTMAYCGSIHASEVIVENRWCDFVFKPDYKLPSLNERKQFIKEYGHLPYIQSEKEVLENGASLGKAVAGILQNTEELTLYLIEINERLNQLEKENKTLKEKIKVCEKVN